MDSNHLEFGAFHKPSWASTSSPSKTKSPRRGKTQKKSSNIESTVEKTKTTSNNESWERKELFESQWKIIEKKLLTLSSNLFHIYVEKLFTFITRHAVPKTSQNSWMKLIPTAIFALNSKQTQQRIANEIDDLQSPESSIKIVHLDSFHSTNITSLFQVLFSSLTDDEEISKSELKNYSLAEIISMWLENNSHSGTPSLVVFFHDFENFNKEILTTLVLALKDFTTKFSIVFVFMIYNHINSSLHYILPALTTDNLLIEDLPPFYEPKLLPGIFKDFILDSTIGFKLHPTLVKEINNYFSNYELSFSNFLFFIKSIVFDHFYFNPLSLIYSLKALQEDAPKCQELFKNALNIPISDSPSYVDNLNSTYRDLLRRHKQFSLSLEILIFFKAHCLLEEPEKFVALYSDILNSKFDFRAYLFPLLKVKDQVYIRSINQTVARFDQCADNQLVITLLNFKHDIENLIAKESEENMKQQSSAKKLNLDYDGEVQIAKTKLRGLNSRAEWRKSLLTSIQDTQKLSPIDKLKFDFVHHLIANCENHILLDQKELIDGLFYQNISFIRKFHFISFRERLNASFNLAYNSANRSDNLVLYRLYKEAPSTINVHDLFQEFCDERGLDMKKNESIVHFSNIVADFEYIGLLESSNADFMNKLVWL